MGKTKQCLWFLPTAPNLFCVRAVSLLFTQDQPNLHLEEAPAEYAARLADHFTVEVPVESRRELAQFFTPLDVARFMAELARPTRGHGQTRTNRTLSSAVCLCDNRHAVRSQKRMLQVG